MKNCELSLKTDEATGSALVFVASFLVVTSGF